MKLSFFDGFLYAFNPSSLTFISPRNSLVLFYQPAISVSRCGSFPFQRLFRACLNSGFATIVLSVGLLKLGLDALCAWTNNVQLYIPIYVAPRDFDVMKKTHYYTVDTSTITSGAAVSELQFNIKHEEPFILHDLKIIPLPVWHGPPWVFVLVIFATSGKAFMIAKL